MSEEAKAGQEIAKVAGKAIDAGTDLAKFFGKALGTVPEDIVGLTFGDYLNELRIRNLDKIRRKTEQILEEREVEGTTPISTKLAIPLFEAASEESDEMLQDIWARLMANAMDPSRDASLRRVYIDTLKQFEPEDACVFVKMYRAKTGPERNKQVLAGSLKLRQTLVNVSLNHLTSLGCLTPTNHLTDLGRELWLAIRDEVENQRS